MAIREIREALERDDQRAWGLIERKSHDYLRVTISSTPDRRFVKYRPRDLTDIPATMVQALYWGYRDAQYGRNWIRVFDPPRKFVPVPSLPWLEESVLRLLNPAEADHPVKPAVVLSWAAAPTASWLREGADGNADSAVAWAEGWEAAGW